MREEKEKRLEVSGRKRVKNACALSLPIHERNTRRRITVTSSFNDSGRKGDGGGKALLRPPHPFLQQTHWRYSISRRREQFLFYSSDICFTLPMVCTENLN
jgi:hypothetical protein